MFERPNDVLPEIENPWNCLQLLEELSKGREISLIMSSSKGLDEKQLGVLGSRVELRIRKKFPVIVTV